MRSRRRLSNEASNCTPLRGRPQQLAQIPLLVQSQARTSWLGLLSTRRPTTCGWGFDDLYAARTKPAAIIIQVISHWQPRIKEPSGGCDEAAERTIIPEHLRFGYYVIEGKQQHNRGTESRYVQSRYKLRAFESSTDTTTRDDCIWSSIKRQQAALRGRRQQWHILAEIAATCKVLSRTITRATRKRRRKQRTCMHDERDLWVAWVISLDWRWKVRGVTCTAVGATFEPDRADRQPGAWRGSNLRSFRSKFTVLKKYLWQCCDFSAPP